MSKSNAEQQEKKTSRAWVKILVSVFIVLLVAVASVAFYVNGYTAVYPNTYIADVNISGMHEKEVAALVNAKYDENNIRGMVLPLICEDNSLEISVDELGVSFDNNALIEEVFSIVRGGNIAEKVVAYASQLVGRKVISPVLVYNSELLDAKLNEVTLGCEIEPLGHTFTIDEETVTIYAPINGVKVDRENAKRAVEGKISEASFDALTLVPTDVIPEPLEFDDFYKWLTSDAEEAYYEKIDGKVTVHESKPECKVEREAVETALATLETTAEEKVTIPAEVTQPQNTTEKMTENLYKDVLGSYSTYFGSSSASRANNVRLASSRIDGTELMPGEEFSYDKAILPRTYANGYREAGVYIGNKVETGMGGGICQPSSTLYAAALYANLEILERHNHSLSVSYLPAGLDATIAEGYLDLRLRNSTDYPVKLSAETSGGVLTFKIYGYNADNISVDIERWFSDGAYHVTRVVKQDGQEIKRERMTSSVYGIPEKSEEEKKKEEEEKKRLEEQQKLEEQQRLEEQQKQEGTVPEGQVPDHSADTIPPAMDSGQVTPPTPPESEYTAPTQPPTQAPTQQSTQDAEATQQGTEAETPPAVTQ